MQHATRSLVAILGGFASMVYAERLPPPVAAAPSSPTATSGRSTPPTLPLQTVPAPAPTAKTSPRLACVGPCQREPVRVQVPAPVATAAIAAPDPASVAALDATSERSVTQSQAWQQADNIPAEGEDGRVTYTFGAGLPVVVCAPLRICVIELQPGERVNREVQIGDSVRWLISPSESGSGKASQTLVVLKPKEAGLDTNLLIPTDSRSYYVRVVSHPTKYIARVAFNYPQEAKAAWDSYLAQRVELAKSEVASDMPAWSIDHLRFDYQAEGDAAFRPVRVLDNGQKTYIQLPAATRSDELPALVVLNKEGTEQLVNARFVNGWYEVDRLFDRAALILGVGSEQRKVTITNIARAPKKVSVFSFGRGEQ